MPFNPNIKRIDKRYILLENRKSSFDEVNPLVSKEDILLECERCLSCPRPTCIEGCPIHLPIPTMIKLIKEGKEKEAFDLIYDVTPLNNICSIICDQSKQCEGHCIRNKRNEPVNIGLIHRYVAYLDEEYKVETAPKKNKRVAVIGAGPSGLSAAYQLYKLGYDVTIYEKENAIGGIPYYEIPKFRLTDVDLTKLQSFFSNLNIEIKLNNPVKVNDLLDKYDAIYVSIGTQLGKHMRIEGEDLEGVFTGEEFLKDVKLFHNVDKYKDYQKVMVVGAGNVAMDVARTLVRLNKDVTLVYRRSIEEAPCQKLELKEAEEEGVKLSFLTNPKRFIGNNKLESVELMKMELGELDASGRRSPVEIQNSEYLEKADAVFLALGSTSETKYLEGLDLNWNLIKVNELGQTNIPNVFAGGDIVTGPKTVVHAIKAGIDTAINIDNYLSK